VAPAEALVALPRLDGSPMQCAIGTSFAAPVAAGLAAFAIEAGGNHGKFLASWPEALRAITMASATQSVEGSRSRELMGEESNGTNIRRIPLNLPSVSSPGDRSSVLYTSDDYDGVGLVSARGMKRIAESETGTGLVLENALLSRFNSSGDYFRSWNVTLPPNPNKRLRIVLAWSGIVDVRSPQFTTDPGASNSRLDSDLDLYIVDRLSGLGLRGQSFWVGTSISFDNSYEVVDIPLLTSHGVQIRVKRYERTTGLPTRQPLALEPFAIAWYTYEPASE
jgi:hypothetical protein